MANLVSAHDQQVESTSTETPSTGSSRPVSSIFVDTPLPDDTVSWKRAKDVPLVVDTKNKSTDPFFKSPLERKSAWRPAVLTAAILIASFIVLVAVSHTALINFAQEQVASENARSSEQAVAELQSLANRVHESESGARGFAISGKQSHLDQYYGATKQIAPQLNSLTKLLRED